MSWVPRCPDTDFNNFGANHCAESKSPPSLLWSLSDGVLEMDDAMLSSIHTRVGEAKQGQSPALGCCHTWRHTDERTTRRGLPNRPAASRPGTQTYHVIAVVVAGHSTSEPLYACRRDHSCISYVSFLSLPSLGLRLTSYQMGSLPLLSVHGRNRLRSAKKPRRNCAQGLHKCLQDEEPSSTDPVFVQVDV